MDYKIINQSTGEIELFLDGEWQTGRVIGLEESKSLTRIRRAKVIYTSGPLVGKIRWVNGDNLITD